jgi:error-prone DNA polymerase
MPDRQILQWDKDGVDDTGMLKIDLLGLRYLGVVEATVAEVERTRGGRIDLGRIPRDDPQVWERLGRGDTIGTSHTGSRAQQQMLRQTRPTGMGDLAVQVAIVRPGPIQAGSVHPYVENRRLLREDPDHRISYPHPCLEPILARTLGAVVYQDQVLQIATVYAGFTAGQAEGLRRAMSKHRSVEEIAVHQARFFAGAEHLGRPPATTERLWEMVAGYSGYGFPEGHAWCLGMLAYETNYLRIHYAPEYLVASLNEQPVGFSPPDVLVHDAMRHGVAIRAPDVNRSEVDCHVDGQGAVRIGLAYVKGAIAGEIPELVAERRRSGLYAGVADLASRSGAGRAVLSQLAWAGALDELPATGASRTGDRRRAAWAVGVAGVARRQGDASQLSLGLDLPATPKLEPPGDRERVAGNYRTTGLNLDEHPLALLRPDLGRRVLRSSRLAQVADGATIEVQGW